jgi:hypothetical protein
MVIGELKAWNSIPEGARDILKKWFLKIQVGFCDHNGHPSGFLM